MQKPFRMPPGLGEVRMTTGRGYQYKKGGSLRTKNVHSAFIFTSPTPNELAHDGDKTQHTLYIKKPKQNTVHFSPDSKTMHSIVENL